MNRFVLRSPESGRYVHTLSSMGMEYGPRKGAWVHTQEDVDHTKQYVPDGPRLIVEPYRQSDAIEDLFDVAVKTITRVPSEAEQVACRHFDTPPPTPDYVPPRQITCTEVVTKLKQYRYGSPPVFGTACVCSCGTVYATEEWEPPMVWRVKA